MYRDKALYKNILYNNSNNNKDWTIRLIIIIYLIRNVLILDTLYFKIDVNKEENKVLAHQNIRKLIRSFIWSIFSFDNVNGGRK